ncbi:hypothetical protein C8J57DRAFT_1471882 [Mycena rebaudengoi]|nr:hypothetical protein C8J57DRAFT_1471882 [Mycena rebaudengoi]
MDNLSPPTTAQIASFAGPVLIGALVTWLLLGVYLKQTYFYFMNYSDRIIIRGLVVTLTILEIAQLIMCTMYTWTYLITIWGNFSGFVVIPQEAPVLVILCGFSSMIVQGFYAWQVWMITKSDPRFHILVVLILGVSLMQGSAAITAGAFVLVNQTLIEVARRCDVFSTWLIGSFVADTLISSCMLWILFKARNNSPWASSKLMFNKLIVSAVKTGSATSFIAAVTLALFDLFPNANYFGAVYPALQNLKHFDVMEAEDPQALALTILSGGERHNSLQSAIEENRSRKDFSVQFVGQGLESSEDCAPK